MRKKVLSVLVMLVFLGSTTMAHASASNAIEGFFAKLSMGVINVLTGWLEFPNQIVKGFNEGHMGNEYNKIMGLVGGVFDGVLHTIGRTAYGVQEIATCWAADHPDNVGVGLPLDADFAWQTGEAPHGILDTNVIDGTLLPIGNKFVRGITDVAVGFLEFPGQIVKGIRTPAYDLGIVKGIWYFLSREVGGAFDTAFVLFPNPEEPRGYPYDEKWPWDALVEGLTF